MKARFSFQRPRVIQIIFTQHFEPVLSWQTPPECFMLMKHSWLPLLHSKACLDKQSPGRFQVFSQSRNAAMLIQRFSCFYGRNLSVFSVNIWLCVCPEDVLRCARNVFSGFLFFYCFSLLMLTIRFSGDEIYWLQIFLLQNIKKAVYLRSLLASLVC